MHGYRIAPPTRMCAGHLEPTLLILLFGGAQLGAGLFGVLRVALSHEIAPRWPMLRAGIAVAKLGGALVNLNGAFLTLSMCRTILTRLSMTRAGVWLPVGRLITWHRWSGIMFLLGSLIHCAAHAGNLAMMHAGRLRVNFAHPTLILGLVLLLTYALIGVTAYWGAVRRARFEVFSHLHLLTMPSMVLLWLHGSFCFLRRTSGACAGSTTLYWIGPPTALYLLDVAISTVACLRFSYVSKVIQHPSQVIEVQMRKPSLVFAPGQFVRLCLPAISPLQWHPFTLTSAPEEDHLSVHIRVVGDWTTAVQTLLASQPLERVRIFIDGPLGCASQEYAKYSSIICVGAGIGQTPFASILKSLWYGVDVG